MKRADRLGSMKRVRPDGFLYSQGDSKEICQLELTGAYSLLDRTRGAYHIHIQT